MNWKQLTTHSACLAVDAAAPGSLPDFFWTDLTTNEYDFISTGSPPPVHVDNAGSS